MAYKEYASKQGKLSKISSARKQLLNIVQDGDIFVSSIGEFFYYGNETDFEGIKNDIKSGSTEKLDEFLRKNE